MAKIPLRSYNKEIDQQIENGQVAEAIAHCKHILKVFPKHIDTYRLLGQAYLTEQRYTEAADILQRVLSVIPDDFISQIGMSIIREDEGNLDAAIYHMEKAFEVQPAKAAIQSELRRLYGRRDGMEPPKIRLTRGALVRMYLRGELYPQAIAEVRAALADDPQQLDLQVILARLYSLSDQKVQAVEICSRLVSKLPYCLEANRILAEVLPGTSRAEDAKVFRDRLVALDPYYGLLPEGSNDVSAVPDNAVQIERLEYNAAAEAAEQPEWTRTVGVAWEDQEQPAVPSWLENSAPAAQTPAQPSQPEPPAEEAAAPAEIPDWMAQAGWAPSTGEAVEAPMQFTGEETETGGDTLAAPGEIPAWLQSLAPETPAVEETESSAEDEAWLQKMVGEAAPSAVEPTPIEPVQEIPAVPAEDIPMPDWLNEVKEENSAAPVVGGEALPDWLSGLSEPEAAVEQPAAEQLQAAPEAEALPDWLSSLETGETAPAVTDLPAAVEGEEALPDWLQGLGETTAESGQPVQEIPEAAANVEALPDWLQDVQTPSAEEPLQLETPVAEQPSATGEEIPDWLAGFGEASGEVTETAPEIEAFSTPAAGEMAAAPEIEAALPEETPAVDQPLPTAQSGLEAVPESTGAGSEPAEAVESGAAAALNPEEDLDSALAWLEALAAKQGASEEELLTQPEQRDAEMPAWIEEKAAQPLPETSPVSEVPAEEEPAQIGALVFSVEQVETPVVESLVEEEASQAGALVFPVEELEAPQAEIPAAEVEPLAEEGGPVEVEMEAPAVEAETQPVTEVPASVEETALAEEQTTEPTAEESVAPAAMGMEDIDSAMAWLEALAAKQGADEDTLLTAPESRLETAPEWVEAQAAAGTVENDAQPEAEAQPAGEEIVIEEVSAAETTPQAVEPVSETPQELEPVSLVDTPAETPGPAVEGWILESETAAAGEEALPAWLQNLDTFSESAEEPAAEAAQEAVLPEWLQDIEPVEEPAAGAAQEAVLPDWLQDIQPVEEPAAQVESGGEWTPESAAEEPAAVEPPIETTIAGSKTAAEAALEPIAEIPEVPVEEKTQPVKAVVTEAEAAVPVETPASEPEPAVALPVDAVMEAEPAETAEAEPLPTAALPETAEPQAALPVDAAPVSENGLLEQARKALNSGDVDTALTHYTNLTSSGEALEEIIHDLRDATYRYPMNTDVWQALGDAYYKGNHVQDALDAYTKAIELLR